MRRCGSRKGRHLPGGSRPARPGIAGSTEHAVVVGTEFPGVTAAVAGYPRRPSHLRVRVSGEGGNGG
jgi:hypothetical protein